VSSTIEKLARAGEQAGFRVEEMIEMLNAGVSIGALLDVISYSLSHEALEDPMGCLECKNLVQAFESRLSQYIDARTAAYYRVTTELAAKKNVDMERARNDLEQHQLVCVSAKLRPSGPRDIRADYSYQRQTIMPGTLQPINYKFASADWST